MVETKEQKVEQIIELKSKINQLLSNVRESKLTTEKYQHEINYLKEYIGSVLQKDTKQ